MKKLCGLWICAAVLAAAGCGTTEKTWTADVPPPLAKDDRTELDPVKLPSRDTRVLAEDINADNAHESLYKLADGIQNDGRSMSKAGK